MGEGKRMTCDRCGDQACNAHEYTAEEAATAELLALHFAEPMGYTAPLQPIRPDADGVFRIHPYNEGAAT